jgi:hypothetical protein
MKLDKWRPVVLWTLGFVFLFQKTASALPEVLATQFNWQGEVIGHMPKDMYIQFMIFLALVLNFSFLGFRIFLTEKIFRNWVNVPWPKFWKASQDNVDLAIRKTDLMLYVGGTGTNLIVVLMHMVLMNRNGLRTIVTVDLNTFLALTAAFLVGYGAFVVALFKPPKTL